MTKGGEGGGEEKTCPRDSGMSCNVKRRVRICVCVHVCVGERQWEREGERERHNSWHLYTMYRVVLSVIFVLIQCNYSFPISACRVRKRICLPLCMSLSFSHSSDTSPVDT